MQQQYRQTILGARFAVENGYVLYLYGLIGNRLSPHGSLRFLCCSHMNG